MPKFVDHEERRDELGEVALGLIASVGLEGLTFRAIAATARMSLNSAQYHFGTKERASSPTRFDSRRGTWSLGSSDGAPAVEAGHLT